MARLSFALDRQKRRGQGPRVLSKPKSREAAKGGEDRPSKNSLDLAWELEQPIGRIKTQSGKKWKVEKVRKYTITNRCGENGKREKKSLLREPGPRRLGTQNRGRK